MKVYSIILWILAVAIKIFAIIFAAGANSLALFFDPLSLIFDFGITLLIVFTFLRPAKLFEYIKKTVKEKNIERNLAYKISMLYRNISKILYAVSFVGTFIGVILILYKVGSKEIAPDKIASSFAVASLTIYYALITNLFIIYPLISATELKAE